MICFGVNTGRVASFHLAQLLNSEKDFLCLHEGKTVNSKLTRVNIKKQKVILPHLARYNYKCYLDKKLSKYVVDKFRKKKLKYINRSYVCDLAYYNVTILPELIRTFKNSKYIFQVRNCIDFVRSCASISKYDYAPVGWKQKTLYKSKIEKYLDLMRLRPKKKIKDLPEWEKWDFISKNMWLWYETNRLILESYKNKKNKFFIMKIEEFREEPMAVYSRLRSFLNIREKLSIKTTKLLSIKSNRRRIKEMINFTKPETKLQKKIWKIYINKMNKKLGYE